MAPELAQPRDHALTRNERKVLADCEAIIEHGRRTFVEVGNALAQIRDSKLYRQSQETFEAYCRERWDFSPNYSSTLIGGAAVVSHLQNIRNCECLPTSEGQIRPLLTLRSDAGGKGSKRVIDLEEVEKVWQEVIERAPQNGNGKPKITGKHVKETVDWWQADKQPYRDPPAFDFSRESDRIYDWNKEQMDRWPEESREALSKLYKQLSREAVQ